MTTTTDVDARGRMAAAELRSAVEDIRVPAPLDAAPRKRRVALALTALVLVGAVIVAVAARAPSPTTLTTGIPAPLPRLVPNEVPDGSTLHRQDPGPPPGTGVTTAVFASTPRQVRGRAELLVSIRTSDAGMGSLSDGGSDVTVRGHAAQLQEYAIDNGATLRALLWLENVNTLVVVQSATMAGDALVPIAEQLQIVDGAVANQAVGGLSVLFRRSSADQHEARVLRVQGAQAGQFVIISTLRVTPTDIADWLPGKEVDVRGRSAWLSHQPIDESNLAVAISWSPSPGVAVSVYAAGFSDDEALRVARSLRDVSQGEWDALPTS